MKLAYIYSLGVMLFVACTGTETKQKEKQPNAVNTPSFNSDSAYAFVQQQVAFGPRVPGTTAHASCADYLVTKLKSYKGSVFVQTGKVKTYDGKIFDLKNIIAAFNPTATQRIMLTAHWDTRPFSDQDAKQAKKTFDGANDGGSGVAVLLEIARQLNQQQPTVGVDIVLWDLEDYGQPDNSTLPEMKDSYCLGSQYWAKNPPVKGYSPLYCINLDMVGGAGATFTMEGISMSYASSVTQKVWDVANQIGYSSYFPYKKTNPITDDHYYVNILAKIPAIDIIEYDETTPSNFNKHWHTQQDNVQNIDKNTLKAVGQTLLEVLFREGAPVL